MKGEFYKMDYEAWDEGTIELSLEQEAAYLRLCHQMYRRHGPIPNSKRLLCVIFRCGHIRASALLKALIQAGKIWITEDGLLTNHRVTKELVDRESMSTKRRLSGEKGGTRSGVTRRNPLRDIKPSEASASTPSKQIRGEEIKMRAPAREGLKNGGQKDPGSKQAPGIYVNAFDPTWEWFAARYRREHGKSPPTSGGGWYFPEAWQAEAEASRQKAGTG